MWPSMSDCGGVKGDSVLILLLHGNIVSSTVFHPSKFSHIPFSSHLFLLLVIEPYYVVSNQSGLVTVKSYNYSANSTDNFASVECPSGHALLTCGLVTKSDSATESVYQFSFLFPFLPSSFSHPIHYSFPRISDITFFLPIPDDGLLFFIPYYCTYIGSSRE